MNKTAVYSAVSALALGCLGGFALGRSHFFSSNSSGSQKTTASTSVLGEINGRRVTKDALKSSEQVRLHEANQKYYDEVTQILSEAYMEDFFETYAKSQGLPLEVAREKYFENLTQVDEIAVNDMLNKFKDHPQLQQFSESEKKAQIEQYLLANQKMSQMQNLVQKAQKEGTIKVNLEKPEAPKVDISLKNVTSYGKKSSSVVVTSFVDIECPMCVRAHNLLSPVIQQHKDQVHWVIKAFPLNFHPNAKPAAIALRCIDRQGEANGSTFAKAYEAFYESHNQLGEEMFLKISQNLGLDQEKFKACLNDPQVLAEVESEMEEGMRLGVAGTPTFFINGEKVANSPEIIAERIAYYLAQ
jgi:protein-disulfide isomerase